MNIINISEVFKYEKGTMFRIAETEQFEEEFVEIGVRDRVRCLINEEGQSIKLAQGYVEADYILESGKC